MLLATLLAAVLACLGVFYNTVISEETTVDRRDVWRDHLSNLQMGMKKKLSNV